MAKKARPKPAPSECPVCGESVPPHARACPSCGADERTGWNDEATRYDGLNLPNEAFDCDETRSDEGLRKRIAPKGVSAFWWVVGVALIAVLVYLLLRPIFHR